MCGIIGYIGHRDALPLIISGLEKLEYRGYDSAGVAVLEGKEVSVTRSQGKLSQLKQLIDKQNRKALSNIGIGHTRWATHGKPSEENAHPHRVKSVSLVHNGIIENYVELREKLKKEGAKFLSETDTEVAAHLLSKYIEHGLEPYEALKSACAEMKGSYAFLAFDSKHPDRLLVAKNSSPIIVGIGKGEMYVASDIPAILQETREIIVIEDGDIVEVRLDGVTIESNGKPIKRKSQIITWDPATAQKGGYKHYMLKEIHEQSLAIADTFRGRAKLDNATMELSELANVPDNFKGIKRIVLVACGTAWHACLIAKFYLEEFTRIPCEVDYASEFRYRNPILDKETLFVVISQSGETADTLASLEYANKSARSMAICNVMGSSIARKANNVVFTNAGPEISVASTKAFTTQLVVAYLFSIYLAQKRGSLNSDKALQLINDLYHLPSLLDVTIKLEVEVERIAKKFSRAKDFLFIARGICYPVALEGALKLKEISYIHAEGYPAGELKHGPIALIDENVPVVVVLQKSELMHKTLSNIKEVESRGGKIIIITDCEIDSELSSISDDIISVPHLSEYLSPVLFTIPLQFLAYHIAVLNGTDVDQPRNLAKSVTVE